MNDAVPSSRDFMLGDWTVSPDLNQIRRNGREIVLQNLSMQVLVYLAERPGEVVGYDELLDNLWQNRYVGEDAIHRRIADLRRHLGDDPRNPEYIKTIPKKGYRLIAPVRPAVPEEGGNGWRWLAVAAGIVFALAAVLTLVDTEETDPPVPAETASVTVFIESKPPGAAVSYIPYAANSEDWQPLGITPLQAELPVDTYRLRFVADGHAPVTMAAPNPSMLFNNVERDFYVVELPAASSILDGMVYVPGGSQRLSLLGLNRNVDIGEFQIGRTEVSNREFAEFVHAGGYQSRDFWQALAGDELEFGLVATRFVDSTGMPGPAGWANGNFPEGAADMPVTGICWYEAMAYAAYRGMKLPTAMHWARAALGIDESRWPLAPSLLAAARTDTTTPVPVTEPRAMSTWGTLNMVGNVREWTVTRDGEARLSLGLGYASQQWAYASPTKSLALQRAPDQGMRLALYDDDFRDMRIMMAGVAPKIPDSTPDEFSGYLAEFEYVPGSVAAQMVSKEMSEPEHDWIRERYRMDVAVLTNEMPILVFRPPESSAPLQPVIFLPPADSYTGGFASSDIDITRYGIEFLVRGGRALVWPIIAGTHERFEPQSGSGREAFFAHWLDTMRERRTEIGALLDWLAASDMFDGDKVTLLAASYGATYVSPHILASEHRIRTAVLMSGYVANTDTKIFPDVANPNTYWPEVELPILVLNGRYDIATHQNESRDMLVQTIGTSTESKRSIIYDSSHWPLPRHRVERDITEWLDQRLGTVD